MARQSEHGKIIAAAAKALLAPLGCTRVGRSRLWISDQGAWVIVVEFQPSGFSKGSYLNVAPCWLWREHEARHWSFDYGPVRVGGFVPFESGPLKSIQNIEEFGAEMEQLASVAAREVAKLRNELNSASAITTKLTEFADEVGTVWSNYHAAIAAGLSGDVSLSTGFFNRIAGMTPEPDWFADLQRKCVELASNLPHREALRAAVLAIISRSRAAHCLPDAPDCLDGWIA